MSSHSTQLEQNVSVLLAEDNLLSAQTLSAFLENAGMSVTVAADGPTAWAKYRGNEFDVVLLDVMLPGIDGFELCRRMRAASAVPILMVTARSREEDVIDGLALGADDYIRKPYSPREVVARVQRALKRGQSAPATECLHVGVLTLDLACRRAQIGDRVASLTPAEFSILEHLMRRPDRPVTREQLLDVTQRNAGQVTDRAIDTHLYNLRRKLEVDPRKPRIIRSEYGVGYRLCTDPLTTHSTAQGTRTGGNT